MQPLQTAKKEGDDLQATILPVNIANGSINISMSKMASGLSHQAATLPKLSSISPSLSLPKLQTTNGPAHGIHAHGHAPGSNAATASANFAGNDQTAGVAAAATASTAAVGEAVNQVIKYFFIYLLNLGIFI